MPAPTQSPDRRQRIQSLAFSYAAQPKEQVAACNLCGYETFVVVTHVDRYGYPAEAHGCRRCGLVFLNPRMTADAYGRFYDGVYRPLVSAFHGRLIDARTVQAEQRDYARELSSFMRPYLLHAGFQSLLDIGGSTGVVAGHLASEYGLRGLVIDPAPLEIEQARALGLETATGLVESFDFGGRRFDVVLICQTVDHLLDIAGTLSRVRDLIANRGILFVDVVDFRAAYLRNWSVEAAVKIDHPYYLTEPVIAAYLRRAGFDIVRADYAADHLHIGFACRPSRSEPDATPPAVHVESLLAEIRHVQNAPRLA